MRLLWIIIGFVSVGCGVAGIVLPLVPTTPFLLLAAFVFARSSPRLHGMLLDHPRIGPIISNWNSHGVIDRRSKTLAVIMLIACFCISLYLRIPGWLLALQAVILGAVAVFILTRPGAPRGD
ncbi:YbaN family protein [Chelativorans composti]|uniref:YbaN family protein n=1 Tax=Chelativorans composti TaxID=768533 RepID=A0ABW5DHV1_9HYPH